MKMGAGAREIVALTPLRHHSICSTGLPHCGKFLDFICCPGKSL